MKSLATLLFVSISFFSYSQSPWDTSTSGQINYTGKVGIGTTSPDMRLDIEDNIENGVLYRHLTTNGISTREKRTWLYEIGRKYDYPNRSLKFGMLSYDFGRDPSFYVESPSRYGNLATLLTTNSVDENSEHRWSIRIGRAYDFPNRTIDFGMVSDNHGTEPSFYIAPKGVEVFRITEYGSVGIGTTNPDSKLTVNGTIHSTEVKVDLNVPGPDYVFEEDYNLRSLEETEAYIKENKHLPEIPSAKEMEANGLELGEMNMLLLKKVEELTLYLIQSNKEKEELSQQLKANAKSQEEKIEELVL